MSSMLSGLYHTHRHLTHRNTHTYVLLRLLVIYMDSTLTSFPRSRNCGISHIPTHVHPAVAPSILERTGQDVGSGNHIM